MNDMMGEAAYVALVGFSFVFICLIILMYITKLMSYVTKAFGSKERKKA